MSRELPHRLWTFAERTSWRHGIHHPREWWQAWRYYSTFVYATKPELSRRRDALIAARRKAQRHG